MKGNDLNVCYMMFFIIVSDVSGYMYFTVYYGKNLDVVGSIIINFSEFLIIS